jgi:hypothetical protein
MSSKLIKLEDGTFVEIEISDDEPTEVSAMYHRPLIE